MIISTTSFSALAHDEINLKGKFQNIDANNDETISLEEFKNFVLENRRFFLLGVMTYLRGDRKHDPRIKILL